VDVELPNEWAYSAEMERNFRDGTWDIKILNCAVKRALKEKIRMGLFEHPFALEGEALEKEFRPHDARDREVSKKLARESMVLLKNDGILPLKEGKIRKIAVIGPHAGNARYMFGGYTHVSFIEAVYAAKNSLAGIGENAGKENVRTWPGSQVEIDDGEDFASILPMRCPDCRSLYEALKAAFQDAEVTYAFGYPIAGNDRSGFEEALKEAQNADVVILTLGGKYGSGSVATHGEGVDRTDINLPGIQDEFLRECAKTGTPMVGIHFGGSPVSSDIADETLNALIEAWEPAETGAEVITEVLTGEYNPAGRMPVSTARNAGQIPVYYNHPNGSQWHQSGSIGFPEYVDCPHTPRYFFGYGLSYTEFQYSDLHIERTEIGADEGTEISFTVKNTGGRDGDEVAQMYFRDPRAGMLRPVKQLAGFKRIHLAAGESARVRFRFHASQSAMILPDGTWRTEKGMIEIQIGASSEDIRLQGSIRVTGDKVWDGKDRVLYSK